MAKTTKKSDAVTITLTPEEIAAILALRENKATDAKSVGHQELANALIAAIESTKPPAKKTTANRVRKGSWEPKNGEIKPKLRRVMMHHGLDLFETSLSSEEIDLLNKVKPGSYCNGVVKVIKRRDRSVDIDYPVRTASQRLRLSNQFGITSFASLLQRLIAEASDPSKYKGPEDDD